MSTKPNNPVMIYTEQTPNPESLKFVTNKVLYNGTADFRDSGYAEDWSPLAKELFDLPFVKGVYICNNFVTITKGISYGWDDVMLKTKEFIKQYVSERKEIIKEGFSEFKEKLEEEKLLQSYSSDDVVLVKKINDLINTYVKPAVESDGGNIEFKSYDKGVVSVVLQGSCSGCPSSTVTLKAGIEGMLKRMVPEVTEVISEMG